MRTSIIITSSIRAAFERITVKLSAYTEKGAIIGAQISDALANKAGLASVPEWNANLSFKTAKSLDAPTFNPIKRVTGAGPDGYINISVFSERKWNTGTYNKMCGA